ncbi:MAG TPA: sugar ABC transporter permease [Gaiellaceae bacterium]|nr:sugar ABC transporter permease [Gaiellaceae bacterium]
MRKIRRWGPGLLLVSPSILLVAVFVYGLIGWNVKVSLSDWRQAEESSGFDTGAYSELFPAETGEVGEFARAVATGTQPESLSTDPAWIIGLHHAILFTVAFVVGALLMGAFLAFLLDKGVKGEGVFRAIYLFPMAVSFIAAGVVWRWLMNPAPGDRSTGFNLLFDKLGLGFLRNDWFLGEDWGAAALALPAVWALSGYIMALYLAGFRGVPEELREAARMDGASEWRVYRHVVFPHLTPVTLSALIILGHISIKVFDLVVAIGGKQLITQTPAVYMWILIYDSRDYAKGAAIATLLLLGISVLVVPYLVYTVRSERRI